VGPDGVIARAYVPSVASPSENQASTAWPVVESTPTPGSYTLMPGLLSYTKSGPPMPKWNMLPGSPSATTGVPFGSIAAAIPALA
jgi:hypothetical protein